MISLKHLILRLRPALIVILACALSTSLSAQETLGKQETSRNREMLRVIKEEVKKHYFDRTFRGVDLEAKYTLADDMVKNARTNSEAFRLIAAFLATLGDSHTRFVPPGRSAQIEHGWRMGLIGDKCFVVNVMAGSDAEKQGVHNGDEILGIEGIVPTRENFSQLKYIFYALNPLAELNLVIRTPEGAIRKLLIHSKRTDKADITDLTDLGRTAYRLTRESENWAKLNADRFAEFGNDLFIWKMRRFEATKSQVDDIFGKFSKHKVLILDLRGNGGGHEETMLRTIGNLFTTDVKVGNLVRRNETRPVVAKSVGSRAFKGKVIVLIDRDSASASEVLSRVIQLEKRGTVIGDTSGGKVMRSLYFPQQIGLDRVVVYGVSITDSDLIMPDGKSLETNGVTPDKIILPSALELKNTSDPVLSYAASHVGIDINPQKAGSLFPYKWK